MSPRVEDTPTLRTEGADGDAGDPPRTINPPKNLTVAYFLWLIGGWYGLHHFYLRRDRQAFVWCCTLAGGFGIGWLRDLCYMSEYVADANDDPGFVRVIRAQMARGKPRFSLVRFIGEVAMGWLFGVLARCLMPEVLTDNVRSVDLLLPPAIAFGVYIVAGIGHQRGSYKMAMLGAFVSLPFYWQEPGAISWGALTCAISVSLWGRRWDLTPRPRRGPSVCRRFVTLTACVCLYWSLWGASIYFNSHVRVADGSQIPLREIMSEFFISQIWTHAKAHIADFYGSVWRDGFTKAWEDMLTSIDPEGELNAHSVLGVDALASEEEVKSAYKRLIKQWHPDLYKGDDKVAAQRRFVEIQQAYEVLSRIQTRRKQKKQKYGDQSTSRNAYYHEEF